MKKKLIADDYDPKYVHYWKESTPDEILEELLNHFILYSKKVWLILLEEKLKRVEAEIAII